MHLRWADRGIPQVQQFEIPAPEDFPPMPDELHNISPRFLSAFRGAADTTDAESLRFALHRVRLRGAKGQIEATDSRQLFIESGFEFPWEDDLLVTACQVFRSSVLPAEEDIQIGRSEGWMTLVVGPWTIHLAIDTSGRRFPDVEGCIPATSAASTALQLSESDAQFLEKSICRLPCDEAFHSPVTVDLNGAVAVRSRGSDSDIPTELILSGSSRTGDQFAAAMNRKYLQRAVQLGFREIRFQSGPAPVPAPVVCTDEHRRYVWGLLDTEMIVQPAENAVRIDSSQATLPSTPRRHNGRHPSASSNTGTDMTPESTPTNGTPT